MKPNGEQNTSSRKAEHLELCLGEDVQSHAPTGFDSLELAHRALPEIDYANITLNTQFLGFNLQSPFMISGMTGGEAHGESLNKALAVFAQDHGLLMGVGSQRVQLENKEASLFELRKVAPKAQLLANIGAVQLNFGVSNDDCLYLVEELQAQGLVLHLNPLQEAIQSEGNRNFSGLLKKIATLKKSLGKTPLILKETGCGVDPHSARRAVEAGVDAIDIAGMGGTHWGFIEGLRHPERKRLGEIFRNWGIPSAQALIELSQSLPPGFPLIASGGLRHGLDAAKALAHGASLVGMALPFLKAAENNCLEKLYTELCEGLSVAMFCSGHSNIKELCDYEKSRA